MKRWDGIVRNAKRVGSSAIIFLAILGVQTSFAATPYAHTQPTTRITTNSATLNGMAVRNEENSAVWFDWGPQGSFDQATQTAVLTYGSSVIRVSASITGLVEGAIYQCRLVASNSSGVTYGAAQRFTTGSRVVAWGENGYGETNVPSRLTNVVGVAGSGHHTLVLKSDGTVAAWGYDGVGETVVPPGVSNIVGVAAAGSHSLALRADGTIMAWGAFEGTNVPPGLGGVIAIAAGKRHGLALKTNGTVVAWGFNEYGQATVPQNLRDVVAIAAGGEHNLALQADGRVVAWGLNYNGQTNSSYLNNVAAVAGGSYHSLALRNNGDPWAWGRSYEGQTILPNNVWGQTTEVAGGSYYSMVLLTNGSVVVFGKNSNGLSPVTNVPARLGNVVSIAAGEFHCAVIGNVRPETVSQVLYGTANKDMAITLDGTDTAGEVLQFRVTELPAAGKLFQFVNGGRGDPILSAGTVVNDSKGRLVFAPETNGYGNPYAVFTVVASDGLEDSAPATVTLNLGWLRPITQPATAIRPTTATLNGMVLPNGFGTTAWFEWGVRGGFDQGTSPVAVGDGAQVVRVRESIASLTNGGVYQCRLVASNLTGVAFGPTHIFTTGKKMVAWGYQTNVPVGLTNVVAVSSGNFKNLALTANGEFVSWSAQPQSPSGLTNLVAAVASSSSVLALTGDGDVVLWNGTSASSMGLTNIVAIAAGWYHEMALTAEGTVLAWGSNDYGQTNIPPGLSNVVGIATGVSHSLALTADGVVFAWGSNFSGATNVPPGLSNVVAVAAGGGGSLAVTAEGRIAAWGAAYPQGLSNILAVAGGGAHSLALTTSGKVIAWGNNSSGQTNVPLGLTNAVAVAAGSSQSLAVGDNFPPQAGAQIVSGPANSDLLIKLQAFDVNGDPLTYRVRTLPAKGTLYQFSAGSRGTAILTTDSSLTDPEGRVYFVPMTNEFGGAYAAFDFVANDGEADSAPATVAIQVLGQPYASTQSATEVRTNSARLNGMVLPNGFEAIAWFEWGKRGGYEFSTTPVSVGMPGNVVRMTEAISNLTPRSTYQFRVVLSNAVRVAYGAPQWFVTGRRLNAWGYNSYGQTNLPAGLTDVVAAAGGEAHSLALRPDGKVVAWGANYSGQTNVPYTLSNVVGIAASASHSLALKADGNLVGWGSGVGVPFNASNVVAVSTGVENGLALRADGSLLAWGYYAYDLDVVPAGLSNIVAIASGSSHNLALRADGTVFAWGSNLYGQTDVPTNMTNIVAVSCGRSHSLALRNNGTVVAWGRYDDGQTSVPANLNGVVAIAGGGRHSMALKSNGTCVAWGDSSYGVTSTPLGLTNITALACGYSLTYGYSHNLVMGSRPPTAFARTVSGYPNHDSLVTLAGSDPTSDPLSFRVASLPTRGFLFQYAQNGRGVPISVSNTIVTDGSRRLIFAPETNELGTPHATFAYVANDGDSDSAPATVTVNLLLPPPPQIKVSTSILDPNGNFELNFSGQSNATYRVWASTNLMDWELLGAAEEAAPGSFRVMDPAAVGFPQRFYKAGAP